MVAGGLLKQHAEHAAKALRYQEQAAALVTKANQERKLAGQIHGRMMKR